MDSLVFARRLSIFLGMIIVGISPIKFLDGEIFSAVGFSVVGASMILLGLDQRKPIIPLLAFIILAALTSPPSSGILFFMYVLIFLFFLFGFYGFGQVLGYVVGIVAYCSVVSYLTDLSPSPILQMPFLDSLLHLLAGISILSIYPSEGVVAPFHSKYAGGQMARSLIPSLVTIIIIIGPVILSLREHLPFPSGIFLLAMALATSLIMISVAVEHLNKMDQKRAKSHQEALDAWQFFEGVVENIGDAIAVLDRKGKTIYKNKRMEKLDFKLQDCWERFRDNAPVHIKKIKKDNKYFTGWIIPLDKEKSIISLAEITDLIRAQKQLEETIKEKDALLRELHHRIKNNLQVIISLLSLQAQRADPKTKKILFEVQNRIRSMATIHETLYETKAHEIDMQKYIERLTDGLKTQHKNIKFQTKCKAKFNLETSIPLAMLINELLQQSIKTKPTTIKTEIQKHKKEHKLTITHNGTQPATGGGGGNQKPSDKSINPTT
ncbi:MAG: hypothetical protein H5T45_05580 [Thermoplasmatales archaeon]|nr:hypothetical protein [Thermoplasmatales archaeon]